MACGHMWTPPVLQVKQEEEVRVLTLVMGSVSTDQDGGLTRLQLMNVMKRTQDEENPSQEQLSGSCGLCWFHHVSVNSFLISCRFTSDQT